MEDTFKNNLNYEHKKYSDSKKNSFRNQFLKLPRKKEDIINVGVHRFYVVAVWEKATEN